MRTKKRFGILAVTAMLGMASFGAVACSKDVPQSSGDPSGDDDGRLEQVSYITATVTDYSYDISWVSVENAERYVLTCGDWTKTIRENTIDLRMYNDFVFPASGSFTMTFVATSYDYEDSEPVTMTFRTEGRQLQNPEIVSVENGVIKWSAQSGMNLYVLKVNGARVRDGSDDYYHSDSYDASALTGDSVIEIQACGDGVWLKNSEALTFRYKAATKTLSLMPITAYAVENEVLRWDAIGGVKEYMVVDIDFNTTRVKGNSYDMSDRVLVYGVYPVSPSKFIEDADITAVNINYLQGSGTAAAPYLIKTPFDLRAIDYYEARYAERGGSKNYYRLENDLDFDTVNVLEGVSNVFTLNKPFYGVLEGNNKSLLNMFVNYDGGYWALFDHIVSGGEVKNLTFKNPKINNEMQDNAHPLNASIATIAYNNYGIVSGIRVDGAQYTVSGGEIGGIVVHNYGTVTGCTLSGTFKQVSTGYPAQAAYEMAGIVLENCSGGIVSNNTVGTLNIEGSISYGEKFIEVVINEETGEKKTMRVEDKSDPYNNIRSVAGIVSVNRSGGKVTGNSYTSITMTNVNTYSEAGGIVAYNGALSSNVSNNTGGTLTINGRGVSNTTNGTESNDYQSKIVGKQG